jgi:hypothetical protein
MGYEAENTEVEFDETLNPMDFEVQLRGNDITWEAAEQTYAPGSANVSMALKDRLVEVHINGSELLTNGNWIVYNGRKCQLTFQAGAGPLKVQDVYIGKTPSIEDTVFAFSGSPQPVTFPGGYSESPTMSAGEKATSQWVDFEINTTNNYLVRFKIANHLLKCHPMAWENLRTTIPDCRVDGTPTNRVFALEAIKASYPEKGSYTSQIFDTRLENPSYGEISWNADVPAGTELALKVRSGNLPDLSDAGNWEALSKSSVNPRFVGVPDQRYIQFKSLMVSSSDGLATPRLKDLTIDWRGETQLVNIGGVFTKGPEYGIIEVLVDGMPLQSALSVDLLIYKDILSLNNETKRITSSLVADIRPRNTGK